MSSLNWKKGFIGRGSFITISVSVRMRKQKNLTDNQHESFQTQDLGCYDAWHLVFMLNVKSISWEKSWLKQWVYTVINIYFDF